MDYYQAVVIDYLRADRAIFLNTECCIQLEDKENPDDCDPHWYCDAVALDFRNTMIFLCEISFAEKLESMAKRLRAWTDNWQNIRQALERDSKVSSLKGWELRPWLFVPKETIPLLLKRLDKMKGSDGHLVFRPRITPLECTQPWLYRSWNHRDEDTNKPDSIPVAMRF